MQAAKLPNELNNTIEDDYENNTNKYILLEPLENEKYSVRINKTSTNILIEANQIHNPNIYYKIELCLKEFYQLSKGFKMFDTLDEICDALQNIFISKKVSISKKAYSLLIILTINLVGGKEQEINIELICNTISKDINIDDNTGIKLNNLENEIKEVKNNLLKTIKSLEDKANVQENEIKKIKPLEDKANAQENEIKNLKSELIAKNEKITNLEKVLKEQKEEIKEIKNWIDEYQSELKQVQKTKINKITLNDKIDSKIINEIKELEFLENRLKNSAVLKKKNIIYKLLYRATRDGKTVESFHNKCDDIMGTLSIIKTTKGMRFGGYTEKLWNHYDIYTRKDSKDICFCFSFDLFKIYNFNNDYESSIKPHRYNGPSFYDKKMEVFIFNIKSEKGLLFGSTEYQTKHNSFGKFDGDYEINNGQPDFSVVELEVFQILFEN